MDAIECYSCVSGIGSGCDDPFDPNGSGVTTISVVLGSDCKSCTKVKEGSGEKCLLLLDVCACVCKTTYLHVFEHHLIRCLNMQCTSTCFIKQRSTYCFLYIPQRLFQRGYF